ncbi:MAG: 16S rRNA (guanine(966)-N(2))-methyltransferase RsmD [Acidobacteriota bacterium]
MRIVGGNLRGRRLDVPRGMDVRPTSEKVREALFDILGPRVAGVAFLDLYAGTGAVGLEAVSRGASVAVLVEKGARALAALRMNVERLGVAGLCRVLPVSSEKALRILSEEGAGVGAAFCDPPYADRAWPDLLGRLAGFPIWVHPGILVVESAAKALPACPPGFEAGRAYRYGDTALSVFRVAVQRVGGAREETP